MQKASKRPHRLAFLRKWWQLLILVMAFTSTQAQSDSSRYTRLFGHGYGYKRTVSDSVALVPLYESPHIPYRAGAIKYRKSDSSFYKYTGTQWLKVQEGGVATNGIDTVYTMNDTIQVIETPDETYFTIINSPYTEVINDTTIVIGGDTLIVNGKGPSLVGITELTGDGTAGPGSGLVTFTLANTAVTPGSYINPNITVDAKGRVTGISSGSGSGSGIGEVVGGYGLINVNDSTIDVDTVSIATRGRLYKVADSLIALMATAGTANANAGAGYRILIPSTQETKTLFTDITGSWDSTSNTDGLTYKVDTSVISTKAWRQKGDDSVAAVLRQVIIDTAADIRADFPVPAGAQNLQNVLTTGSTLNQNNTVEGAGFRLRYNNGEFNLDSLRISAISTFGTPSDLYGFGDSYMEGFNPSDRDTAFVYRVGTRYGIPVTNWGVSARGIWRADSAHNFRINPGHAITSFIWAGFNDIRRGGINNDTTYRKVIQGLKAIIANQFLKSYVAGGTTGQGVTRHGSWTTTYTAASVGGKSANNGAYSQTNNDSIVYVFPAADSSVVIATINGDNHGAGFNMGSFDVFVNGVLHGSFNGLNADGISDGANANDRSPNAFIITGLPYGIHRITLINTSANFLVVDYFGHLVDKTVAMPLLIGHAPYNNIDGFAVSPNKGSVAAMDKLNNQIDSMVAVTAVGWPIFVVETNNFLDTLTGIASDDIHPNNTGDLQITTATMTALPAVNAVGTDGTMRFNGANFIGTANGSTKVIPWRDETLLQSDTIGFIRNQTGYDQNAAFRINQASIVNNRLTVGSTSLANGADQLDIITSSGGNHMRLLGFSGTNFWQSINSTNQTGLPLSFGGAAITLGQISGGSTTTYATFNNTATNKFSITGNALINSTVRIGSGLAATDAPITIGTVSSLPYLSFYRSTATTDQKIWDNIVGNDSVMLYRVVTDNFLTPDTIYYAQRSGATATRLVIPKATLSVGRWRTAATGFGAYFNRSVAFNLDSVETITSIGSDWVSVLDATTGKVKKITAANLGVGGAADGNGIYDGSGTLPASATTTVNGGTTSNLNLGGAGGNRLATFSVNSAGLLTLNGLLQLGSANSADADYSIPAGTSVARLVEISATRTVTIPDVGSGQLLIIWNENSSGNAWNISVTGGGVINPDGSSITSFANDSVYILLALNGNYVRIN